MIKLITCNTLSVIHHYDGLKYKRVTTEIIDIYEVSFEIDSKNIYNYIITEKSFIYENFYPICSDIFKLMLLKEYCPTIFIYFLFLLKLTAF